mmetsp:Transcript_30722/g.62747  ORF Transcript_30722/g.62747 Transcript_30722/m.62747 type:complete len:86 (+) Transcript_30722:121-378(+)
MGNLQATALSLRNSYIQLHALGDLTGGKNPVVSRVGLTISPGDGSFLAQFTNQKGFKYKPLVYSTPSLCPVDTQVHCTFALFLII